LLESFIGFLSAQTVLQSVTADITELFQRRVVVQVDLVLALGLQYHRNVLWGKDEEPLDSRAVEAWELD
jgi:hypothetical protein